MLLQSCIVTDSVETGTSFFSQQGLFFKLSGDQVQLLIAVQTKRKHQLLF